jgi:hypothetical protein
MATVPYDICSFAVDDQGTGDIVFTFLASREITIEEGIGWVEVNPSEEIEATIYVDDVAVAGSSVVVGTDGTVTITIPSGFSLSPGEVIDIILDNGDGLATPLRGLGITLKATIETDNEDPRYDVSFFIEGRIPGNRTIAASVIPRQINIHSTGFQVKKNTEQLTGTLVFFIRKNGVQIGTISSSSSGPVSLIMNTSVTNFEEGDVFSIFAPGSDDELMDESLADISITFKGFIGVA